MALCDKCKSEMDLKIRAEMARNGIRAGLRWRLTDSNQHHTTLDTKWLNILAPLLEKAVETDEDAIKIHHMLYERDY